MIENEPAEIAAKLAVMLAKRIPDIKKFERYYAGDQGLAYASPEWAAFNSNRFANFADNWVSIVANSPAERIRLTGIQIGEDVDVVSENEEILMAHWYRNEMDAQSTQGFLHTIVAGRSFVFVWPTENDGPTSTWERADQVIVSYDEATRKPKNALKVWVEDDTEFGTLFSPTEVFKFERPADPFGVRYTSHDGGWVRRSVAGESWPEVNPLGEIPIVEVPNRPSLGLEPLSDVAGVTAMQDAVNLLWAYLFSAADFSSMPARVVMGEEPPMAPVLDAEGQIIGSKPIDIDELAHGRMLWLTGGETSIGQWDSAKLDTFTDVIEKCVRHIASQSRTPIHYILGDLTNINSETLIASETGLVKKVEDFELHASLAMRRVFRLIALADGDKELAEEIRTAEIVWANPQTRTQAQASDAALKDRQVGFPFAWVAASRYGLTPPEVERVVALREEESVQALENDLAIAFGAKSDTEVAVESAPPTVADLTNG